MKKQAFLRKLIRGKQEEFSPKRYFLRSLASRTLNVPNLLQVQPKDERAEKKYSSSLK